MAIDQFDETVVTHGPSGPETPAATPTPAVATTAEVVAAPVSQPQAQQTVRTESRHSIATSPGRYELTRRVMVLVFGLIQIVIGLRIVLLVLDAREANGLVSGILNVSQLFVAPFDGILRTNALHSAGSILDISAIVAFVGWTILELVVIWAVAIFRREPMSAAA